MPRKQTISSMFKPGRTPKFVDAPKGEIGYDNPRENIDEHVRTKAVSTQEVLGTSAKLGDHAGGNYVGVDEKGTLKLFGESTMWDDVAVDIGRVRLGASAPTWTAYKGSEVLAFDKGQDNKIFFTCQIPHKYKEGSDIEFHIHVIFADSGAGNVRWDFSHSWANIGDDFPNATDVRIDIASPQDADNHQFDEIASAITGTGKKISSVLLCSLMREGTHANDTYDDDVYLASLDFHVEMNTVGSRTEQAK